MTFYSSEKLRPRRIEIDETAINCENRLIQDRLSKIARNYDRLDEVLADIESKMLQNQSTLGDFPQPEVCLETRAKRRRRSGSKRLPSTSEIDLRKPR